MTDQRGGASPPIAASAPGSASASASASAPGALGLDPHGTSGTVTPQPPVANDKPELPWAFIDCSSETLVVLIAHMLDLLCQHNDQVVLTPDALTRFHSRAPPNITVIEYLRRIVKYTNLEKIPLLSLLAYIDLTCQNLPTFTLSSLTVHRFLIAGVTAGSKAQCDVFCTNSHYAKVGGIKVGELNSLEREFLRVTGWALCCNSDLLQRYYTSLIRSHGGYRQAEEPAVSPFRAFPDAGKPPPIAHQQDSSPTTPMEADEEADATARRSDYGSGDEDDEEEDVNPEGDVDVDVGVEADVNGDLNETAPKTDVPSVSTDDRGRARARGDAMDVDSPEVRSAPAPAAEVLAIPSRPSSASADRSATARGALKQFVGGIFRRHDNSTPVPGTTPEKRLKSRPLGESTSATTSPVVAPTGDGPKPLTPRVRTRDERSVDSLRGAPTLGVPVVVDDGKRRARVE